jgi:hypothetical protein
MGLHCCAHGAAPALEGRTLQGALVPIRGWGPPRLAGCCFRMPTSLPWERNYAPE